MTTPVIPASFRICADCAHCELHPDDAGLSRCAMEKTAPNYVSGQARNQFCEIMRMDFGKCGPDGRLWAKKASA